MAAPADRKDLSPSGCDASSDLVEGRVGNLIGLNLRSSLNNFRQGLQHCWIGFAGISFRVLFLVPQTDSHRFRSVWDDERNFVLEALLFSK